MSLMNLAFGEEDPPLLHYPHIALNASQQALRILHDVTAEPLAIWGEGPKLDNGGIAYSWADDGPSHRDFHFWRSKENQEYAYETGYMTKLNGFSFVISALTPTNIVNRMYRDLRRPENNLHEYYRGIRRLHKFLDQLRWLFVPLGDELDIALFCASKDHANLVNDYKLALLSKNAAFADSFAWKCNNWEWPAFCR